MGRTSLRVLFVSILALQKTVLKKVMLAWHGMLRKNKYIPRGLLGESSRGGVGCASQRGKNITGLCCFPR